MEGGLEGRKEENGSGIPQAFPATTPNRKCMSSLLYRERERKRERIFPFLCVAQKHLVENELRLERNDAGIVYVICRGFFIFFSSCKGSF